MDRTEEKNRFHAEGQQRRIEQLLISFAHEIAGFQALAICAMRLHEQGRGLIDRAAMQRQSRLALAEFRLRQGSLSEALGMLEQFLYGEEEPHPDSTSRPRDPAEIAQESETNTR